MANFIGVIMEKNLSNGRERRSCVRVEYPAGCGPRLVIGEHEYEVMDISEKGIKFITDHPERFCPGLKEVAADITFRDGKSCEIQGAILRIERTQLSPETRIAIFLYEGWGIPSSRIDLEMGALA